jgi:hypothetical protein
MDSLSNDPVATVLRRLFQEAKIADGPLTESYRDRGVGDDELAKYLQLKRRTIERCIGSSRLTF